MSDTNGVERVLVELLQPMVARLVREEVERRLADAGPSQRWLPVSEVARRYDLSENAVRQRVQRGAIPGKRVERRIFVDVVEWERQLSANPEPRARRRAYSDPKLY